jgi:hypothetical protein
MSTAAAVGGGQDGNGGGGDRDSSHHKGKNTYATPNPKKMNMFKRGMLRHMQGKTADTIARGEEPPWDALMVVFMLWVVFMLHHHIRVLLIH